MRAILLVLALSAAAPRASAQLTPPPLEDPPQLVVLPAQQPPVSFERLYGSAWAGSAIGMGIGALTGLLVALPIMAAVCSGSSGDGSCNLLVAGAGFGIGVPTGSLIGSIANVWRVTESPDRGALAILGALLVCAASVGIGAVIGLAANGNAASGVSGGLAFGTLALPQLGAAGFAMLLD